ncbi:MAG: hypothetical protein ACRELB_06275, partial [Polyangiaceae bacterium]
AGEAGPGGEAGLPVEGGTPLHDGGPLYDAPAPDAADTCQGPSCSSPPQPPPGDAGPATKTTPREYALHTLYLGDTDRNGTASASAWKTYGYDLDGLTTTVSSTDACTLQPGAAKSTQVDGLGGIDNSFGENILPIILTTAGNNIDQTVNAGIAAGHPTNLVYTTGFDDTPGSTASATGLTGALLGGADYALAHGGAAPAWDLGTHWPVAPESLSGCPGGVCPAGTDPIAAATQQLPHAYQSGGTFVSGSPASVTVGLSMNGTLLPLVVREAVVTFRPGGAGAVTGGTVAGVLSTTELVAALQRVAGAISTSLCSGSAFQSIAQQIEQASDIVYDPATGAVSNHAGVACNAISIGLGFDATEIAVSTPADVAGPTPPAPDPCGD